MVAPAAGGVVLVPFPFSDLSEAKLRPAVRLTASSFSSGSLRAESYARPGKLFTASRDLMVAQVGVLNADARQQVVNATVAILRAGDGR